ncbi:hypothetical protein K488DRAFT_70423 [Vararia minispora EC-137]|uniref:Uncharacterized protein n=1 Tax=Vararia minispora EC-137 TaxID=1314806 RepID=A0ACB8QLJ3_9AGAM|nr:hypothetical protein K488DRAFT_70423 [Vararia minispora EC-137]
MTAYAARRALLRLIRSADPDLFNDETESPDRIPEQLLRRRSQPEDIRGGRASAEYTWYVSVLISVLSCLIGTAGVRQLSPPAALIRRDSSSSTSGWTPIQILTPIIVGLGLLIIFTLYLLYRRHREHGGSPIRLSSFLCCGSRPRRVRPERNPRGNWSVDVDNDIPFQDTILPPPAVISSRSSTPSASSRPRPVRTVPRRLGTILQGVQSLFGRPIEVFAVPPGAPPYSLSDDESGHDEPVVSTRSRRGSPGSPAPSDPPPPVPPKDSTGFWTRIRFPRFGGSSSERSQAYDPVSASEDEYVIIHYNSGLSGNAIPERGRQPGEQRAPTASSSGQVPARARDNTPLLSNGLADVPETHAVGSSGEQLRTNGSSISLPSIASAIKTNLVRTATAASSKRRAGPRRPKSALSDRGAPAGTSAGHEEEEIDGEDPDERRVLNDAVTPSESDYSFQPPLFPLITASPTESTGVASGESQFIQSRIRKASTTTSADSVSPAGTRSVRTMHSGATGSGTSRTGTTHSSNSRDRRSLEVYPPTPGTLEGHRFSLFPTPGPRSSIPPATLLPPSLPGPSARFQIDSESRPRKTSRFPPPSSFTASNFKLSSPPARTREHTQPQRELPAASPPSSSPLPPPVPSPSPPAPSPPSPSPIVETNDSFYTADAGLSPVLPRKNNELPTYASTASPALRLLPLPISLPPKNDRALGDGALPSHTRGTMVSHANVALPPPSVPLPSPLSNLPSTNTTTTSFSSDGSSLHVRAPPNSSASGGSDASMSPHISSIPPSSSPLAHSPAISRSPAPPSAAYSPPSSSGKDSCFPPHAPSESAAASQGSLHVQSHSIDMGLLTSLRERDISGALPRPSSHIQSASMSQISLHSSASKSSLRQSPAASFRPLPSPSALRTPQRSPPASRTTFQSPAASPSYFAAALPRGPVTPPLAPNDPRNLTPPHIRGAGYDPYSHEGQWGPLME